ncbi:GspH/FimT family pseudopilin [Glaciecola sp. SC05]|uniref:GspH/FimT family pseudopilin n=1 Tax=Glaciecola sp. SC05 TaxID=1987355 RepID=UPI00352821F4
MTAKQGFARPQLGLTLVEILIGLALLSIVFGFAAPSAVSIIDKHRITAQVNYMSSVLQYTRHHAVDQHIIAALCPSDDLRTCNVNDWNLPKMLFADHNHNGMRDQNEALIHATPKMPSGVFMRGPNKIVRFYEDGTIGTPTTILICPQRAQQTLNRALFISLQGRVRPSQDTNQDEIHERGNKQALVCV